ncbi:MAG TPA: efflux RND transporter periplasmic adaptor subunit, partial [Planctomycetota bacterium]|nr:efflux RND transporter periplasmic adaptor subunit [Planctomycetota bacterium]
MILSLALLTSCDGQGKDSHGTVPRVGAGEQNAHAQDDGHAHGVESEAEHVDEVMLTTDAIARYGVKTQAAQLWALRPTITAPARVSFNTEAMAHVGSQLRGRIAALSVRVGDPVKVGQELAVIESPELGEAQADYLQRGVAVQTAA